MNEVFFSAFLKLVISVNFENPEDPKASADYNDIVDFADFKFVDLLLVQELWNGRIEKKDYYDEDDVYTFQDINHDVLCTYVSSDMAEVGKTPEILTTVISSRFENTGRRTRHQNTWIYFEGTIEELRVV